jgi:hypothetical protein
MRRSAAAGLVGLALAGASLAQEPGATVREELEVREVPVLVDLPAELRGRSVSELRGELLALEAGGGRTITALQPSPGYRRVLVVLDQDRCRPEVARRAVAALGAAADRLAGFGPVEVETWRGGERQTVPASPASSAQALSEALGQALGRRCRPRAPAATLAGLGDLACAQTPCLLVWVTAGWASPRAAERSLGPADALGRDLAGRGWTVLGLAPVESAPKRWGAEPETRPGDDRAAWTVDVLHPGETAERNRSQRASDRQVGLELAPLADVVSDTAGELVTREDELDRALVELGTRSLLFYRTDATTGAPLRFELRRVGGRDERLRAPAWVPATPR